MTALDEIQQAIRDLTGLSRREQPPSREEVLEALEKLRGKIRAFIAEVSQLYDATILVTSKIKSADLAAALWKNLHEDFSTVLEMFERIPKLLPDTDRVIEHSQNILRSIVDQADQEYRSYAETAYLLGSNANARHLGLALEEAESGNLPLFESGRGFAQESARKVKVFRVTRSPQFISDYAFWQAQDERKCKKIDELIKDTSANPFKGIGHPEPLKHNSPVAGRGESIKNTG